MAELIRDGIAFPDHDEWRRKYDAFLAEAADEYADVFAALRACEIPASMTQTGGLCLAIEILAPHGWFWLTDREDVLSFDRDPDQGWALGYYPDTDDYGECLFMLEHDIKNADTARELVLAGIRQLQGVRP